MLALAVLTACSAAPLHPDLAAAEDHEHRGDYEQALRAYRAAQRSCLDIDGPRRRRARCRQAHLQHAELLTRMGRHPQALTAYDAIATALPGDRLAAAEADYRAGRLELEHGDEAAGYRRLWRVVTHYADQPFAVDALKVLVRDGRQRDADALYRELTRVLATAPRSAITDNLHLHLAELAEHERNDVAAARMHLDAIAEREGSPLRDDALWHGAALARQTGDAAGAVTRLRALLATREVPLGGIGSYFSVWLDNAQLELGRILRDDLRDLHGALKAFQQLPEDYPASVLQDDAQWEIARTHEQLGDVAAACKSLERLARRWPDSKYELDRAPALRQTLRCAAPPTSRQ